MKAFKYIKCEVKKYKNESFFKYIKCENKEYKIESFQIYKMWR